MTLSPCTGPKPRAWLVCKITYTCILLKPVWFYEMSVLQNKEPIGGRDETDFCVHTNEELQYTDCTVKRIPDNADADSGVQVPVRMKNRKTSTITLYDCKPTG